MARYGVVVYWPDKPAASEQVLLHAFGMYVTYPLAFAESRAILDTATTSESIYSIRHNGVEKGTLTFAASSTIGSFTCPMWWAAHPGDTLEIIAPDTADATAAGLAITLMGTGLDDVLLTASLKPGEGYSKITATMDHIFLYAHLECEAEIPIAKIDLGNLFPPATLIARADILVAYLTPVFSFHAHIRSDGGSEMNGFLTVVHDAEIYQ